jgi:WhiB family redox-sensing transcriptional regulator
MTEPSANLNRPSMLDHGPGRWVHQAACQETPFIDFFPSTKDVQGQQWAKAICARCPVRDACLEYALVTFTYNNGDDGIWGATTHRERIAMRRAARRAS